MSRFVVAGGWCKEEIDVLVVGGGGGSSGYKNGCGGDTATGFVEVQISWAIDGGGSIDLGGRMAFYVRN